MHVEEVHVRSLIQTILWDVESLELQSYVLGEPLPHPASLEDLMLKFARGGSSFYEEYVVPRIYQDMFGRVHVNLEDLKGVEIVHEEE